MKSVAIKLLSCCVLSLWLASLFAGCITEPISTDPTQSTASPTESIRTGETGPDEFSFVVVGKTTLAEVFDVVSDYHTTRGRPPEGLLMEFEKQGGGYVHITFREDGLVCAIGEAAESVDITDPQKKFYTLEDFASIVVGESTSWDVRMIYPQRGMTAVSFGGLQEIPMEGGGFIVIEYQGPDMYVRDMYTKP